jgi:hypothetical protein
VLRSTFQRDFSTDLEILKALIPGIPVSQEQPGKANDKCLDGELFLGLGGAKRRCRPPAILLQSSPAAQHVWAGGAGACCRRLA